MEFFSLAIEERGLGSRVVRRVSGQGFGALNVEGVVLGLEWKGRCEYVAVRWFKGWVSHECMEW